MSMSEQQFVQKKAAKYGSDLVIQTQFTFDGSEFYVFIVYKDYAEYLYGYAYCPTQYDWSCLSLQRLDNVKQRPDAGSTTVRSLLAKTSAQAITAYTEWSIEQQQNSNNTDAN